MGSSTVGVYIVVKSSLVENFKHECKNDMVDQYGNTFFRGVKSLWRSSFLGLQPLGHETWSLENSNLRLFFNVFFILSAIPIVVSNNLILGWTFWPIGALLYRSLNLSLVIQFLHCQQKRYLNYMWPITWVWEGEFVGYMWWRGNSHRRAYLSSTPH